MRRSLLPRRRDGDHALRWPLTRPAGDPLSWDIHLSGPIVAVVLVDGELDVGTAPGLAAELTPLADAGRHLVLDLAGLEFCDCAGLSLFLRLDKRAAAAGGSLHLAAPQEAMLRLIKLAGLADVLPVTGSAATAIAALERA
jgi:anti-anti-sigma factor